jgi:hypothetical protein
MPASNFGTYTQRFRSDGLLGRRRSTLQEATELDDFVASRTGRESFDSTAVFPALPPGAPLEGSDRFCAANPLSITHGIRLAARW